MTRAAPAPTPAERIDLWSFALGWLLGTVILGTAWVLVAVFA